MLFSKAACRPLLETPAFFAGLPPLQPAFTKYPAMSLLAIAIAALLILIAALLLNKEPRVFHKQKAHQCHRRRLPKPPWVKREIIRIKAHMQDAGRSQTHSTGVLQQKKG
jgi:hypothetical protein